MRREVSLLTFYRQNMHAHLKTEIWLTPGMAQIHNVLLYILSLSLSDLYTGN